ncbi:sigma-54 interaction domain-containing protein [Desulfofustis limnaeus]|jgi:PAS domain S-box-containing protein|uniref:Fis family transcriptional regulator n=1 Tax=Desulfofustis limnaeus TaxID=2740163 RepID=A0ABN6M1Y8_9BACT|nr:sigma 54-interacting transcriptional regulator [Desulfofustis limnaeus]MDX9896126.1 sigma 54-interacting transcriptional regulator [Desulfofustis sp.]BDD85821.1 Fis family transcriptional regulator [Desulfofustis limnaeus]
MNSKGPPAPLECTEIILESISDGVFTVDLHWRITSFNRAAEEITGISRHEAIGRYCWEVFRSNMCEGDCALRRTMEVGKSFVSSATSIITSNKKQIPITVSTSLLKDGSGEILGGVEVFRDMSLIEELRRDLRSSFLFSDMISRSPAMLELFGMLDQIAQSDSTVLIEGETGTGKELLSRAIHNLSPRQDQPFIAINCGALPDTLLESELFGYKAGAFTDARSDRQGLFSAAEKGTILLDEIGDTSPAFQVRLLRVLEDHTFQPLGSTVPIKTNARLIAATNRDLHGLVETNQFRRDLFYRINIIALRLPPLRDRMEDIPLLVDRFIAKLNRRKKKLISGIDEQALDLLLQHDFPGNIRELENIIEHAFVLCPEGPITPRHLPAFLNLPIQKLRSPAPIDKTVADSERDAILKALHNNHNNRTAAAMQLGLHKSTLFRKVKKLGISLPEQDGRSTRS